MFLGGEEGSGRCSGDLLGGLVSVKESKCVIFLLRSKKLLMK
jgi:hypothetical protein